LHPPPPPPSSIANHLSVHRGVGNFPSLSETASLALRLHQDKDIILTDGSLDVADDGTGLVLEELDANLGDTTTRSGAAEDTGHTGELDGLLAGIHFGIFGIDSKTVGEGWTACLDFLRRQLFFPLF